MHTRNRRRYFLQLLLFAVISEVPWYLLDGADGTHNVMFTLALGITALAAFEKLHEYRVFCCCVILMIAWLAAWLGVDYEWRGILMIVIFYLLGCSYKYASPFGRMTQLFCAFPLIMHYGIAGALLACMVLCLYDGTRGFIHGNTAKYGFYSFYPAHLMVIFGLANWW